VEAEISRGDVDIINVPANRIAEELGNPRSANIVMLGAFTKKSNIVSLSSVIEGLKDAFKNKQKLIAINKKALMAGYDLF
jgi:2-oxoglutarate ferredoxin oxidoreductase subunit gamma